MMRKLRSRLAILLAVLVLLSCAATLFVNYQLRGQAALDGETLRLLLLGSTVKDVFLSLLALCVLITAVVLIARRTASPIRLLSDAANQIAHGNYDVQVKLRRDRVEEYGELQRNFNVMARELQNNDYLRKDFISSVSHELKTPLAIIQGYADLLQEETLDAPQRQEYAQAIFRESARLSRMTENMLRLSRMDSGNQTLERTAFLLDEQIRRCVIALEPQWAAKNIQCQIHLEPIPFSGDEALLEQVWLNLLENAVKFSDEEGVIGVHAAQRGGEVVVCVWDRGVGMDADTRAHMFERFFQGDTSRRQNGSGLGLSIVRRIVQLHGGEICVDSERGRGTRISVTLAGAHGGQKQNK